MRAFHEGTSCDVISYAHLINSSCRAARCPYSSSISLFSNNSVACLSRDADFSLQTIARYVSPSAAAVHACRQRECLLWTGDRLKDSCPFENRLVMEKNLQDTGYLHQGSSMSINATRSLCRDACFSLICWPPADAAPLASCARAHAPCNCQKQKPQQHEWLLIPHSQLLQHLTRWWP